MPPRGPAYRPNSVPDNNRRARQAPAQGQAAVDRARTMRAALEERANRGNRTLGDRLRDAASRFSEDVGAAGAWLQSQFAGANANLAGAAGAPGGTQPGGGQQGGRGPTGYERWAQPSFGQSGPGAGAGNWLGQIAGVAGAANGGAYTYQPPPPAAQGRFTTQLPDTQNRGVLTYPGMPQYLVDMINTYNYNATTGVVPVDQSGANRRNAARARNPQNPYVHYEFAPVLPPPPSGGGGGGSYDPWGGWGGGGGGGGGASDLNRWYESMVSWSIGQPKPG